MKVCSLPGHTYEDAFLKHELDETLKMFIVDGGDHYVMFLKPDGRQSVYRNGKFERGTRLLHH